MERPEIPLPLRNGIGSHQRGHTGRTTTWLTPLFLINKLGAFDLDPCCPPRMPWTTASVMYHEGQTDGLHAPWTGRVWLNPPYGPHTGRWLHRLACHGNGIALIFARTETEMFHTYCWQRADAMLFLRGRLHFCTSKGRTMRNNAGGPSVLVAYGRRNAMSLKRSGLAGALWQPCRK